MDRVVCTNEQEARELIAAVAGWLRAGGGGLAPGTVAEAEEIHEKATAVVARDLCHELLGTDGADADGLSGCRLCQG